MSEAEYQKLKADADTAAAAAAAILDTSEKAFPAIEVSASDSILYNENGVEVFFTECTREHVNGEIRFNFHVSNQNPDNKKGSISFSSLSVNYLNLIDSTNLTFSKGIGGLAAGEEADIYCVVNTNQFDSMLEKLGETVKTVPIETLSLTYNIKVGSNSEDERRVAELKTSLYHEGDIEALLGTYVGSISMRSGQNIDVYAKDGDFGIVAVAINPGDDSVGDYIHTYVNGEKNDRLNGRSRLANLEKKCKLAFLPRGENFNLASLV